MIRITVNEPGATTLADARPMVVNGKDVYVTIEGGIASLHVNGWIAAQMDAGDMTASEAQSWAVEYLNRDTPTEPDMDAVEEALSVEAVYADSVEAVRATGATLARDAEVARKEAPTGKARYRLAVSGSMVTVGPGDPRHPMQRARTMMREAAILSAWTAADESDYVSYVSDGLADTDGTFFPMDRFHWKGLQG